jgi:hypothetical protein
MKIFAPSLLNELFDDFKLIAVFMLEVNFPRTRMKTITFPYRLCEVFYKGGFEPF